MAGPNYDAREKELQILLRLIQSSPSKDWTKKRERIAVLNKLIVGRVVHA